MTVGAAIHHQVHLSMRRSAFQGKTETERFGSDCTLRWRVKHAKDSRRRCRVLRKRATSKNQLRGADRTVLHSTRPHVDEAIGSAILGGHAKAATETSAA